MMSGRVTNDLKTKDAPLAGIAPGDDGSLLPDYSQRAFWAGLVLVILSLISALATYLILTGLTPIVPKDDVVVTVLFVNIVLILAMVGMLVWQARGLRRAWKRKAAGARLHVRVVGLFTLITALPAIVLAMAATTTFSRALDGWFSSRIRSIIENSSSVAKAYVEEHGQLIRTDIVNMVRDIDDEPVAIREDPKRYHDLLMVQAGLRELPFAYIIDRQGSIKNTVLEDRRIPFAPPPPDLMAQAEAGQVPLMLPTEAFRVAAVAKLGHQSDTYLYVARHVNPRVVQHLNSTAASVAEYQRLRQSRGPLKLVHGVMYSMISLTAVLAAIWVGMWFASLLVAPIRRLISAAQHVSGGNLDVVLPIKRGEGDLRRLSATFNQMTAGLKQQQSALVATNAQLTERRRFIEAVLEGVSAGVIGLDRAGNITLANAAAAKLLGRSEQALVGRACREAVPELAAILDQDTVDAPRGKGQQQITILVGEDERTFAVRLTAEQAGAGGSEGQVVTLDDITELVTAQRTAAWADVARRIAHEIKNPLTPIQLAAERIRRKYGSVIKEDKEVFDKCTDTIIRQVGDVARMVDEFSSFARMPKPEMATHDIREVVRDPVFLYQMSGSEIEYKLEMPKERIMVSCDARLLSQAITNLVKNASEAVQAMAESADKPAQYRGRVETRVQVVGTRVLIEVIDNGIGLPKQNRSRLLEPYVTTRAKGTGLGLAIVQKVIEQHAGTLTLEDAPPAEGRTRGALVRIDLPMLMADQSVSTEELVAAEPPKRAHG